MKSGKSVRLNQSNCTNCGKMVDGATVVDDSRRIRPTPNDVTVCIYCGHWMAFDQELQLRELTTAEMIELAGDERLIAISRARQQMNREKK